MKPSRSPDFNLSHSLQELKDGIIREIASNSKLHCVLKSIIRIFPRPS